MRCQRIVAGWFWGLHWRFTVVHECVRSGWLA